MVPKLPKFSREVTGVYRSSNFCVSSMEKQYYTGVNRQPYGILLRPNRKSTELPVSSRIYRRLSFFKFMCFLRE